MKYVMLLLPFFFIYHVSFGQRQWGINDSTFYEINNDSTIIAARHKLYLKTGTNLSIIHDFTDPVDSTNFIRDFDFFDSKNWYVLIGSKYIGFDTYLYKTFNGGITWKVDSSYLEKSDQNSVNQVQVIDSNTIFLFDGYYYSRLIYSDDRGAHWTFWFESLFAYFHGIFICTEEYYLYGFEGDAFNSYMFKIPDDLFPQTEVLDFNSGCPGVINPNCFYAPSNISKLEAYNLFEDDFNLLCDVSNTDVLLGKKISISVYPNPNNALLCIKGYESISSGDFQLIDMNGIPVNVKIENNCIDLHFLQKGIYFLKLVNHTNTVTQKIIKY